MVVEPANASREEVVGDVLTVYEAIRGVGEEVEVGSPPTWSMSDTH